MNQAEKLLFKAIKEDSLEKIATALSRGVNLNKVYEKYKTTPLLYAIKKGNENMATILLEHNADAEMRGERGETPLFLACFLEHYNIADILLDFGANPNAGVLGGPTPLNIAIINKNLDLVKMLLDSGADIDYNEYQLPLNTAIEVKAYDILEELLRRGANANLNGAELPVQPPPLIFAIKHNSLRAAKLLLDKGANIEIKFQLMTPLYWASGQSAEFVKLLCERGADVNFQDSFAKTSPLMSAANSGNVESVRILCEYGANKNLISAAGKKAAQYVNIDSDNGPTILEILASCGVTDPTQPPPAPPQPVYLLQNMPRDPRALEILNTDPQGGRRRTRRRKSSNRSRKH